MDNSDRSLRAGALAAGTALRCGGDVVCLHVKSYNALVAATPDLDLIIAKSNDRATKEIRDTILEISEALDISIEYLEREGNPYKEIVKVATDRKVDHVFVGASARTGYWARGSLAFQLVLRAAWPVTVVP
jgi:nucleotide-binding universal stress UspA family protein